MVTGEMLAEKAKSLLAMGNIPYVNGGESVSGMDCQGLVEWTLRACGIACDYRGTNDMWRNMLSERGSVEECVARWGKVPLGALIFLHSNDGGEPGRYQDDLGNAWHVYVKAEDGLLVHASAGNGRVTTRTFADKTIPNGGPNAYGLVAGVVYTGTRRPGDVADGQAVSAAVFPTVEPLASAGKPAPWTPRYTGLLWRKGDRGNGPREVQEGLRRLGAALEADSVFGPLTEAAVVAFQTERGLLPDGVVGKQTWAALREAVNGRT